MPYRLLFVWTVVAGTVIFFVPFPNRSDLLDPPAGGLVVAGTFAVLLAYRLPVLADLWLVTETLSENSQG